MGTYLGATFIACTVAVAGASALQHESGNAALERVQARVDEYVVLRRDATAHLPPLAVTADMEAMFAAVDAAAGAIRAARPGATQGDIFDARARAVLRDRIWDALRQHGDDPAEILAFMRDDDGAPSPAAPPPAVNGRFSWAWPSFMVPYLLDALPALPPGLEYRFVERDLILIDIDADLVVDILADAFPPSAYR